MGRSFCFRMIVRYRITCQLPHCLEVLPLRLFIQIFLLLTLLGPKAICLCVSSIPIFPTPCLYVLSIHSWLSDFKLGGNSPFAFPTLFGEGIRSQDLCLHVACLLPDQLVLFELNMCTHVYA